MGLTRACAPCEGRDAAEPINSYRYQVISFLEFLPDLIPFATFAGEVIRGCRLGSKSWSLKLGHRPDWRRSQSFHQPW